VLLVYFSFYILLGLAEELIFGRRRRAAARAHSAAIAPVGPESDPDEPLLPAEEDDVNVEGTPAPAGACDDGEHDP
jgi:hypothetical protein